jgi:tetratricopeptide (TPR) repeat protein
MLSVHSWQLDAKGREQEVLEGIKILDKVDLPSAEVEMHKYAASVLTERGDPDAAVPHVAAASRIADTIRSADVMIQSFLAEAERALNLGDWASARAALAKAMEFDPLDPRILRTAIEVECLAGELKAARDLIEPVVKLAASFDATETPHMLAATSLGQMVMLYNDFADEPYLLDVAARHEEFQIDLESIEPIVRFGARALLLSIRSFEGPDEDMLREFAELSLLLTPYSGQMGLSAFRLGATDEAIRLLGVALNEARAGESQPYVAFYSAKSAEILITRNQPGDREQATQLQDEAITIAQKLGMKTILQRILAQREILEA